MAGDKVFAPAAPVKCPQDWDSLVTPGHVLRERIVTKIALFFAHAQGHWPEEQYPTLYRDIPDDIRRPVTWDGRLPGGIDVAHLMWRHLTPAVLVEPVDLPSLLPLEAP